MFRFKRYRHRETGGATLPQIIDERHSGPLVFDDHNISSMLLRVFNHSLLQFWIVEFLAGDRTRRDGLSAAARRLAPVEHAGRAACAARKCGRARTSGRKGLRGGQGNPRASAQNHDKDIHCPDCGTKLEPRAAEARGEVGLGGMVCANRHGAWLDRITLEKIRGRLDRLEAATSQLR